MYVQCVDICCELKVCLCELLYMLVDELMRWFVQSGNYWWCIECIIIYSQSEAVFVVMLLLLHACLQSEWGYICCCAVVDVWFVYSQIWGCSHFCVVVITLLYAIHHILLLLWKRRVTSSDRWFVVCPNLNVGLRAQMLGLEVQMLEPSSYE